MSLEKLPCFCIWREMTISWKLFVIVVEGPTANVKTLFLFQDKMTASWKTLLCIIFLMINDLVINFFIYKAYCIACLFIRYRPKCSVCSSILRWRGSLWYLYWNLVLIYMDNFYRIEKNLVVKYLFYMTWPCIIFIFYWKDSDVSQENLCFYSVM